MAGSVPDREVIGWARTTVAHGPAFCTLWAWWAAPVGIVVTVAAYWGMTNAAGIYADLLRATFDLYRFALYEQLRWPLPSGPAGEQDCGQELSEYLFRGTAGGKVQFTAPKE